MNMYKKILYPFFISFIIVIFLNSCTPEKRVARIVRKYHLATDTTLFVRDTITIKEQLHDTSFIFNTDTIFYETDRTRIEIVRDIDTMRLLVTEKADTIYTEKPVQIEKIKIVQEKTTKWWVVLVASAFSFLVGFFVFYYIRKLLLEIQKK